MAIVTQLGTNNAGSGSAVVVTLATGAPAGASLVVAVGGTFTVNSPAIASIGDSVGGNAWQIDNQINNTTDKFLSGVCSVVLSNPIPPGGSVTVNFGTFVITNACIVYVYGVSPGFVPLLWNDSSGTFQSQGTISGTATAANATATTDFVFTTWFGKSSDTPLNITIGYTVLQNSTVVGGRMISISWKEVLLGGAVAATGMLASSDDLVGTVASYKEVLTSNAPDVQDFNDESYQWCGTNEY